MYQLRQTLIEKCEIGVHKDASGWHLSARGALGIATVVILVLWLGGVL
jgi:hypothetical protein